MEKPADSFQEWMKDISLRAKQIHRELANHGMRIFCVDLANHGNPRKWLWVHDQKTVHEWRQDIRFAIEHSEMQDEDGRASDSVFNALGNHLRELGYAEVADVVADVFEGRITNNSAKLTHNPAHEDQADGFGHYGWESKTPDF
jgi:hypothetical protein